MDRKVYEFISKQTGDPIVERRTCRWTGKDFPIYTSELQALQKISPEIGDKKYILSLPQLSPEARQIKRLAFRNERKFYKTPQDHISTISPEMNVQTISQKDFMEHTMLSYGKAYSGDIMSDIQELIMTTPFPSKLTTNMDNSEYCNQESDDKNCYLNAGGHFNEDSLYNTYSLRGKRTVDNYWVRGSENIYQSINVHNSQKVFYSHDIEDCFSVRFSNDVSGSQYVILSSGIHTARYVYKNKTLAKEEWEIIQKEYMQKIKSYTGLQEVLQEYQEMSNHTVRNTLRNVNVEKVIGNNVISTKNALLSIEEEWGEDIGYANICASLKDCRDAESIWRSQRSYNVASGWNLHNCIVATHSFGGLGESLYTQFCTNSSYLFWCKGLNHKQYCILNKQYTKEERERLTSKIIEELQAKEKFGEFLDIYTSPFPYNDTIAMEYYPITLDQLTILQPEKFISDAILDLGGEEKIKIKRRTRESEINIPKDIELIAADTLPDILPTGDETILNKAIICQKSWRPFRITKTELLFYQKHGVPLPRKHPDVRHEERIQSKSPRELHLRHCDNCNKEMLSVYDVHYTSKVYCETCYNNEIYW